MWHMYCNSASHTIYSRVSSQCSHAIWLNLSTLHLKRPTKYFVDFYHFYCIFFLSANMFSIFVCDVTCTKILWKKDYNCNSLIFWTFIDISEW